MEIYRIEYRGGSELVAGTTVADALDTFYNYIRQEHGFEHVETAIQLFPVYSIARERR